MKKSELRQLIREVLDEFVFAAPAAVGAQHPGAFSNAAKPSKGKRKVKIKYKDGTVIVTTMDYYNQKAKKFGAKIVKKL